MNRFLCIFALLPCVCLGQTNPLTAPVAIVEAGPYGNSQLGAGFITGEFEERLYIVTANHVVKDFSSSIRIKLAGFPTVISGEVHKTLEDLDLAILSINIPEGYNAPPSYSWADSLPKPSEEVTVIGHPTGNEWDLNSIVRVKSMGLNDDYVGARMSLYPIGLDNGHSGGVVLNKDYQLISMVQEVSNSQAICLRASIIRLVLKKNSIPSELMIGISSRIPMDTINDGCKASIQKANSYYEHNRWELALSSYEQSQELCPDQDFQEQIDSCKYEISIDIEYNRLMYKGKTATTIHEALSFYQEAKTKRNTREVRDSITQKEKEIQIIRSELDDSNDENTDSLSSYYDPLVGDMIWVETGSFNMGREDGNEEEQPIHSVLLDGFWIGKHEVTVEQYLEFCNETKTNWPEWLEPENLYNVETGNDTYYKDRGYTKYGNPNLPIAGVTWQNANAYCEWLYQKTGHSYKLPSEAQWEYAARGGNKSRNSNYAGSNSADEVAWYYSNSNNGPHIVGKKRANELGIYDMSGNLWEWCADLYDPAYYQLSPLKNPIGPSNSTERVVRGGCWYDTQQNLRLTRRNSAPPNYRDSPLGFRISRIP